MPRPSIIGQVPWEQTKAEQIEETCFRRDPVCSVNSRKGPFKPLRVNPSSSVKGNSPASTCLEAKAGNKWK